MRAGFQMSREFARLKRAGKVFFEPILNHLMHSLFPYNPIIIQPKTSLRGSLFASASGNNPDQTNSIPRGAGLNQPPGREHAPYAAPPSPASAGLGTILL